MPFYEAKDCNPFSLRRNRGMYLIYLTSTDSKKIKSGTLSLPKLKKHLDKFEDVITSDFAPYGLHRARQLHWFEQGSKIISVRKTKSPCFVWTEREAFFNQAVTISVLGR